jgi:hypothetical protein
MTGEFTSQCNHYYQLSVLHAAHQETFKTLLDNAPLYHGQTRLNNLDAIITYNRQVQAAKAKMDKTLEDMAAAKQTILLMMRYFEIPPLTVLTGEIPGQVEYQLWTDENDAIHIRKTMDLKPEEVNPNIIFIKFSGFDGGGIDLPEE